MVHNVKIELQFYVNMILKVYYNAALILNQKFQSHLMDVKHFLAPANMIFVGPKWTQGSGPMHWKFMLWVCH